MYREFDWKTRAESAEARLAKLETAGSYRSRWRMFLHGFIASASACAYWHLVKARLWWVAIPIIMVSALAGGAVITPDMKPLRPRGPRGK